LVLFSALLVTDAVRATNETVLQGASLKPNRHDFSRIISDTHSSNGKVMQFYANGTAKATFSGELSLIKLYARGQNCYGAPEASILVDGDFVAKFTVGSTFYQVQRRDYTTTGGTHTLSVRFENDYNAPARCDRNLVVDKIKVVTKGATSPPPLSAAANPFAGQRFYAAPNSNARITADQLYAQGRTAEAKHAERLAEAGDIFYFSEWTQNAPGGTSARVDRQTDQIVAKGALPVYGVYAVPHRDCGAYSSGGFTTGYQYKAWINDIATGLQGRRAVVIVEPDGITSTDCLSSAQLRERFDLIRYAVDRFQSRGAYAYIDGGNCFAPESFTIPRLKRAGIADATGFTRNVSNFCWTQDEVAHGKTISAAVGGKPFVIDTSRNGLGPYQGVNNWCNPPGRALGPRPTANTGDPLVHAYYWLKRPGESDGTCNGYPSAGTWVPEYALGLARRAAY
jgi:endoglucanase